MVVKMNQRVAGVYLDLGGLRAGICRVDNNLYLSECSFYPITPSCISVQALKDLSFSKRSESSEIFIAEGPTTFVFRMEMCI